MQIILKLYRCSGYVLKICICSDIILRLCLSLFWQVELSHFSGFITIKVLRQWVQCLLFYYFYMIPHFTKTILARGGGA